MANISIELSDDACAVKGDMQIVLRDILGRVFHLSLRELNSRYNKDWRILSRIYPSPVSYPKVTIVMEVSSRYDYDTLKADVTETFKKNWETVVKEMCDPGN